MSTDDLAARRARHRPALHARCFECRGAWPCDAAVLGAALEAEILARQRLENTLLAAEGDNLRADYALAQERQARQGAAARLPAAAAVLDELVRVVYTFTADHPHRRDRACPSPWCAEVLPRLGRALQRLLGTD